jgi:hypothetical protein
MQAQIQTKEEFYLMSANNTIGTFKPNLVLFTLYSKKLFKRWSWPSQNKKAFQKMELAPTKQKINKSFLDTLAK